MSCRNPTWPAAPPCVSRLRSSWIDWPISSAHPASIATVTTGSSPRNAPLRPLVTARAQEDNALATQTLSSDPALPEKPPAPPTQLEEADLQTPDTTPSSPSRWGVLLARIHEVFPLICPSCRSPGQWERNRNIRSVRKLGRREWYASSGYSRRSLVENAVFRYKRILGMPDRVRVK
jgi:hypothetical protein